MRALLLTLAASPAFCGMWFDCSQQEKITHPLLTFANVTSSPDPVVKHCNQSISKTITWHGKQPLTKVTARLEQYWKVFNRTWFKFLAIDTDFCSEHAAACPLTPGVPVVARTQHPPLAWGTPYGFYRSKQVYYMGEGHSGEKIGCVDMRFEYCKDDASCKYATSAAAEQEQHLKDEEAELLVPADAETEAELHAKPGGDVTSVIPTAVAATTDGKPDTPCCEVCHAPRSKYYSVVTSESKEGLCGEACMLPALYPIFKVFESNLTLASSRDAHACRAQLSSRGRHFTVYNSTVTHGVPGLSITLDLYAPGSPQ